jgi:hypothetical protein
VTRRQAWNNITNQLTPWSRVLPEKLIGPQLVEKYPTFYGTQRFNADFTRARHLSISWARSVQSIPPHSTSERSILILSSYLRLCLPSGLFPTGLPNKTLYALLLSPIRATCPAHLIPVDFITQITFGKNTNHETPRYVVFSTPVTSSSSCPNIFLSTLLSKNTQPTFFPQGTILL